MAKRRKKKRGGLLAEFAGAWHDLKRDYTAFLRWNAKRRTTNNKLKAERAQARKTIASEKAVKTARKRGEKARRLSDAEERRRANRTTPVTTYEPIYVPPPPTRPLSSKPAARPAASSRGGSPAGAKPCGARTQDGSPCQIPVGMGGKCAIDSHRPKSAPAAAQRPAPRLKAVAAQQTPSRPGVTTNVASEGYTRLQVGQIHGQPTGGTGDGEGGGRYSAPRRDRTAPSGPVIVTNRAAPGAHVGEQVGHINGPITVNAGEPRANHDRPVKKEADAFIRALQNHLSRPDTGSQEALDTAIRDYFHALSTKFGATHARTRLEAEMTSWIRLHQRGTDRP